MFNFGGIEYRIFADGVLVLVLSVILLIFGRIHSKINRDKKCIVAGLVALVYSIAVILLYSCFLYNPVLEYYDGEFIRQNRNSSESVPLPFTSEYCFSNAEGSDAVFFLDSFTAKEIIDSELIKGESYRIYYETHRNIIVKVEKINENVQSVKTGDGRKTGDGSLIDNQKD